MRSSESKWQVFGGMLKDLLTNLTSVIGTRHYLAQPLNSRTGRKAGKALCIAHHCLDLDLILGTEDNWFLIRERHGVRESLRVSDRDWPNSSSASQLIKNLGKHSLVHPLAHDSWCVKGEAIVALD